MRERLLPLALLAALGCGDACGGRKTSVDAGNATATTVADPDAGEADAGTPHCFTVEAGRNTMAAKGIFFSRKLEGNGPTWAGILHALVRQYAQVGEPVPPNTPGVPAFGVALRITLDEGPTWYLVDDEADAAVFCSGSAAFAGKIHSLQQTVNEDPAALERVLSLVSVEDLE